MDDIYDPLEINIRWKEKQFLTFSVRKYFDPPKFGIRNLSSANDRFAIDLKWFSLIFELWFLRR